MTELHSPSDALGRDPDDGLFDEDEVASGEVRRARLDVSFVLEPLNLSSEIIQELKRCNSEGVDQLSVEELLEALPQRMPHAVTKIDGRSFNANLKRIVDVQRKIDIHPPLFGINSAVTDITIMDSRFLEFIRRIDEDELDDILDVWDDPERSFSFRRRRVIAIRPDDRYCEAVQTKIDRAIERKDSAPFNWIENWRDVVDLQPTVSVSVPRYFSSITRSYH